MSNKESKVKGSINANEEKEPCTKNSDPQAGKNKTDFDSAWQEVIERLFEPFTEFFFPDIHKDIDFSKGIEILDSELREITPYGNVGKRCADEFGKSTFK